jgi:hypothetical protein
MLTIQDLITASGKYPDRLNHAELTPEVKSNLAKLLGALLPFLMELGITQVKVSSGWRPSTTNKALASASKTSTHMIGLGVDFVDVDGKLDELISKNDKLKKKYGLWQEHPDSTKGWAHLDLKDRGKRAENTFKP